MTQTTEHGFVKGQLGWGPDPLPPATGTSPEAGAKPQAAQSPRPVPTRPTEATGKHRARPTRGTEARGFLSQQRTQC